MISLRAMFLLSTGLALLVIWYFIGGRETIVWWGAVRAAAAGGWDISGVYRDMGPQPLRGLSLVVGGAFFVSGALILLMDVIRRIQKAMNG